LEKAPENAGWGEVAKEIFEAFFRAKKDESRDLSGEEKREKAGGQEMWPNGLEVRTCDSAKSELLGKKAVG